MQELKGLNTTEFYSRFFVETALEKYVVASAETVKELSGIGEKFLTRFHSVHKMTSYNELYDHQEWFHGELLQKLGYKNLEAFFHRANGNKGIPVRGKLGLIDNEELWIIEGPFGITHKETEPLNEIPHCSSLHLFGEARNDLTLDKSSDYQKQIREILADKNQCSWIIFMSGEKMYLFEREKTLSTGSFVEVDWPEVFSNKDNKVLKAVIGLFGFDAFKIVNGDIAHNQLAETAHREAHGVTKELKKGVRSALELLINEALWYHRNVAPSATLAKLEEKNTNDEVAKILADQGLRYLYRLLFLFFIESRGQESEILPIKSRGYSLGYSLENIRNLELKRVFGSQHGNYIQQTLEKTFNIMFYGVELSRDEDEKLFSSGFECPRIGTLLFDSRKTPVLSEVILRDFVMKDVVSKLSIGEMGTGKNRKMGRISYANLGLNQLGAVYEGLLSLKPIVTDDEYYTAILGTKDEEFLIPKDDLKKFKKDQILQGDNGKPILHQEGDFLFRTMGYERKYSASFYTDETLTKCLVKECLEEYFKDDSGQPSCKKIEDMKVLEPAMGSGAFLNETANQLAVYYADALEKEKRHYKSIEVEEDGKVIAKQVEKDRVELVAEAKEYIMKHCLYGVDLNPMATELAKVSLWLNCVHKNGSFAFHDFKIRRGNSLVGAFVRQKSHFSKKVHHFLVPLPEMVDTYIDACELKDKNRPFFNKKQIENLKKIKKSFERSSDHLEKLEYISVAIDELYDLHSIKRDEFRKLITKNGRATSELEEAYRDYIEHDLEYEKLRAIMDYWCSLWFWNPEYIDSYPVMDQFIKDVEMILEKGISKFSRNIQVKESVDSVPFFHYDLEFPEVFADGGFDLVLGNPPWAQLSWTDYDFFSDCNLKFLVDKVDTTKESDLFLKELENTNIKNLYQRGVVNINGIRNFLSHSITYPFNDQSKTNTYKYFWQRSYSLARNRGIYGVIKQNGIIRDKGTEELREKYYLELEKLYRFINEKKLFTEIGNLNEYVLSIFRKDKGNVQFDLIDNLYHPITIERCRKSTSLDDYPGNKDAEGKFDLRGHPDRIVPINKEVLREISKLESTGDFNPLKVSLPIIHGKPEWEVIEKAINYSEHIGSTDFTWCPMFDQHKAPKQGLITTTSENDKNSLDVVLIGPNIFVGNPFYQNPNPGCKNHRDYSEIDLSEISEDFFVHSKFKITPKGKTTADYIKTNNTSYKIISRSFVSSTGARTLSSALYPSEVSHIENLSSIILRNSVSETVSFQGFLQSLLFDYFARNIGGARLNKEGFWNKLPNIVGKINIELQNEINIRTLRLNCLSCHYKSLWDHMFTSRMKSSLSLSYYAPSFTNSKLTKNWKKEYPLRDSRQREQALCETDALVAMALGVSSQDLLNLYRSQFGALQKKLKDLPGQNEPDSFPRAKIMQEAYQMFLKHFGVTEKQVVAGYFQSNKSSKEQAA